MRVSKEKAARNRQKILAAAARLFRQQGLNATGVDSITEAVGLTHGAVYSQFGSKEAIAVEAIHLALVRSMHLWQRTAQGKERKKIFPAIVGGYLSREHRDSAGRGCVIAALGSEIARRSRAARDALTVELKHALEFLVEVMPGDNPSRRYDDAITAFASMVGGLILARAVSEEKLSDRILRVTAKRVLGRSHH